jgi:hypothetical protein
MRSVLDKLGFILCVVAVAFCLVLHLATFLTAVSLPWIVLPFFLVAGAILCAKGVESRPRFSLHFDKVTMLGWILLIYAVCCFVYEYKTTGGATSVGIVDGQYVSMYKSQVLRVITQGEYRMFPNLWTRVMTAWIGAMTVFCAKSFTLPRMFRSDVNG